MPLDSLHFDTQSTSYRTQGRIFFSLLIVSGNILIPLMVLSAHLSRNRYSRSPIFMNLCYSFIFYSTTFLLSFYGSVWDSPNTPNIGWKLCTLQTILTFVGTIWASACCFCLVLQLWFTACERGSDDQKKRIWSKEARTTVLSVVPYCFAASFALLASMTTAARPDLVGLRYLFCGIAFEPLRIVTTVCVGILLLAALCFLGDAGRRLCTTIGRRTLYQRYVQGWRFSSLFFRLCCLQVSVTIGITASIFLVFNEQRISIVARSLIQAVIPLTVWLTFGTNPAVYVPDGTHIRWPIWRRHGMESKESLAV